MIIAERALRCTLEEFHGEQEAMPANSLEIQDGSNYVRFGITTLRDVRV